MNLYHVYRGKKCSSIKYDEYDSFVAAADNEEEARNMHPNAEAGETVPNDTWPDKPWKLTVVLLGKASKGVEKGVICASFNAA